MAVRIREKFKWYTAGEMSDFMDVSVGWWNDNIKPYIPEHYRDKIGQKTFYYGRACLEIWGSRKYLSAKEEDIEEILLGPTAGSSESMERWRNAKAEMAELDLAIKKKDLLRAGDVKRSLMRLATLLRDAGEKIRNLSKTAGEVLDLVLDNFAAEIENWESQPTDTNHKPKRERAKKLNMDTKNLPPLDLGDFEVGSADSAGEKTVQPAEGDPLREAEGSEED